MDDREKDIGVPHQWQDRARAASASGAVLPRALSLCHLSGTAIGGVIMNRKNSTKKTIRSAATSDPLAARNMWDLVVVVIRGHMLAEERHNNRP